LLEVQFNLAQSANQPTNLRLRNDLYCVEWGVKLYSVSHQPTNQSCYTKKKTFL